MLILCGSKEDSTKTLKTVLAYGGFYYTALGDENEGKYIIHNPTLNDAKVLARNYCQKSFLYFRTNEEGNEMLSLFHTENGGITYEQPY